ncbi:MAG: NAD-dependent epimerase/dehydratase family protein [Steroidobacteraceae bacterium]
MQKSILVLGANGFIGSRVVAALGATGWATPILGVRRPRQLTGLNYEQRSVEATNVESIAAALQDVAGVVNCVAADPQSMVAAARALFEAAARSAPSKHIVHLSTMSVYGSAEGRLDESAPLRADLGPYSESKVAAEAIAAKYPSVTIFRPGCVFGPHSEQWTNRFARLLISRRLGDLGAAGDGCCNLVHVDDVATAVVRALETPQQRVRTYNLSTNEQPTWNEYLVRFATALRAVPVRRLTSRRLKIEGKLLAPPLKIAEILGRRIKLDPHRLPPPIPPSLIRLMGQDIRLQTQRVEAELGQRWQNLQTSLEETARWYLANPS